jgi:hypothetical protein
LGTALVLAILHLHEIRWWVFAALFLSIDMVGYLPGAIAWRRSHGQPISHRYYIAYNITHSLVTSAVVAAVLSLVFGPEWALLALPIHLCGDRALFGNFLKPFGISFEPQTHPAYQEFRSRYEQDSSGPASVPTPASVG